MLKLHRSHPYNPSKSKASKCISIPIMNFNLPRSEAPVVFHVLGLSFYRVDSIRTADGLLIGDLYWLSKQVTPASFRHFIAYNVEWREKGTKILVKSIAQMHREAAQDLAGARRKVRK